MSLVSQAEYARRLGITGAAVSQWKKAKKLVIIDGLIDVEKSDAYLKKYRTNGMPEIKKQAENVKHRVPTVKQKGELNVKPVCLTCADVMGRLAALDYTQTFDWTDAAQEARAKLAAQCLGWSAVQSDKRDDGHWGGFQLRMDSGGIAAGYGFELMADEVLLECLRQVEPIDDDDEITVRLDLLPLLARPFHYSDRQN